MINKNTPQPNFYSPAYYNMPQPPSREFYPLPSPPIVQRQRDTVYIRDTIVVTKTDTIINNVPAITRIREMPKEIVVKEKINYGKLPAENVLFGTGQATIRQVYLKKLTYLADILLQNPKLMLSITGHTDKTGSAAANELLSLKRANAVKSFFVRKGISETRMQVVASAAENPLVTGNTNNAKMQNRRVEIKILE